MECLNVHVLTLHPAFPGLCEAHRAVFRDLATVAVSLCSQRRVGAKVGVMRGYWRCGVCCYRSEWIFLSRGKGERVFVLPLTSVFTFRLGCSLFGLSLGLDFLLRRPRQPVIAVCLSARVLGGGSVAAAGVACKCKRALPTPSFSWVFFLGGSGKGIFFSQI